MSTAGLDDQVDLDASLQERMSQSGIGIVSSHHVDLPSTSSSKLDKVDNNEDGEGTIDNKMQGAGEGAGEVASEGVSEGAGEVASEGVSEGAGEDLVRQLQKEVKSLMSIVSDQAKQLAELKQANENSASSTQITNSSHLGDTSESFLLQQVSSGVGNGANTLEAKNVNGDKESRQQDRSQNVCSKGNIHHANNSEVKTLASIVRRLVTRLMSDGVFHDQHDHKQPHEQVASDQNDPIVDEEDACDEEVKLLQNDINELVSNLDFKSGQTVDQPTFIKSNESPATVNIAKHDSGAMKNPSGIHHDSRDAPQSHFNTDYSSDYWEKSDDYEPSDNIVSQESLYIMLLTENVLSRGYFLALILMVLSTISLMLVVVNSFGNGSSSDNPLDIPVDISLDVRIAQFVGTIIGILTEQESLQGIMLLAAHHQGSLFLDGKPIKSWKLVFCSMCFITIGYLFLINLALVVAKADDVLSLFADILALEFVLNIDNAAFQVVKSGIFGERLKNATTDIDHRIEVEKNRSLSLSISKRHLPKFLYSLNVLGLLAWLIAVVYQQDRGLYGCESVMVTFGDQIWEDVTIIETNNREEDRVLLYSYFNGIYKIEGTNDGRPRYVEQNKLDGSPFSKTVGAEIVYCGHLNAWVFRHDHISKSVSDSDEKECRWLMRSGFTQAYNLLDVANEEWSTWVGEIETGSSLSIVCNECERNSDCNYHGTCVSKKCQCEPGYFGQQCELELPCGVLITDNDQFGDQTQLLMVKTSTAGDEFVTSYNRPIYLMTGLSGIPEGLLGVSDYSDSQYGDDDFFPERISSLPTVYPSFYSSTSSPPSRETVPTDGKVAPSVNPSSSPTSIPSSSPSSSRTPDENELFLHYTFVLTYSGSRWFGTMDRPDLDVKKVYDAEYHAFWQNTFRDRTFLVSDPTTNGSPIGVDFFAPRRRKDEDRDYGPFGVLLPHFNIDGVGFFQCYEFTDSCSIIDIEMRTENTNFTDGSVTWDLIWKDTDQIVGDGVMSTNFYRYRRCLAEGLYTFRMGDERECEVEVECEKSGYSIRVNEQLLKSLNGRYAESMFDFAMPAAQATIETGSPSSPDVFCSGSENFQVMLRLDDWPHETSWELVDENSTAILEGGPYPIQFRNKTLCHGACLRDGLYNFTLYDSYGDGIADPGQFNLLSDSKMLIRSEGRDFSSISSVVFHANLAETNSLPEFFSDRPTVAVLPNVTCSYASFSSYSDYRLKLGLLEESSSRFVVDRYLISDVYESLCLKNGQFTLIIEADLSYDPDNEDLSFYFDMIAEEQSVYSIYSFGEIHNVTEIISLSLPGLVNDISFCRHQFSLTLLTDEYPQETSWTLATNDGDLVLAFGSYDRTNTAYKHSACLTTQKEYNFTIEDSFGDGLSPPAFYSLSFGRENMFSCSDFECTAFSSRSYAFDSFYYDELFPFSCPSSNTEEDISEQGRYYDLSIILGVDSAPWEITWALFDDAGIEMYSGGPFYDSLYVSRTDLCLLPGVYNFAIYDSGGDGILCPGFYYLLNGNEIINNYTCGDAGGHAASFTFEEFIEINTIWLEPIRDESTFSILTQSDELITFDCPAAASTDELNGISAVENFYDLSIVISTDDYPFETNWTLVGNGGNEIYSGGPYAEGNYIYRTDLCLLPGIYDFTIYDTAGDGIFCPGYYYLIAGTEILAKSTCEDVGRAFFAEVTTIYTDELVPSFPSAYQTSFVPTVQNPFYYPTLPPQFDP